MTEQKLKIFLWHFYNQLEQDNWGDIDPEYFNPEIVDEELRTDSSEFLQEGKLIQKYINKALKEIE